MIDVIDITKTFGRGRKQISPLRGISHRFEDSTLHYVLGLNGAGKSTLLRILSGIIQPSSGTVLVDGKDLSQFTHPALRCAAFVDTNAANPAHTGRRHMEWVAAGLVLPAEAGLGLLTEVGLADAADRYVGEYSLGMRQRLGIATALLSGARNLVIDEPLNGLDIAGILWMRGLLRELAEEQRCIVIASHYLAEVERGADQLLVLEGGVAVAAGAVEEIVQPGESLEQVVIRLVPLAKPPERPEFLRGEVESESERDEPYGRKEKLQDGFMQDGLKDEL